MISPRLCYGYMLQLCQIMWNREFTWKKHVHKSTDQIWILLDTEKKGQLSVVQEKKRAGHSHIISKLQIVCYHKLRYELKSLWSITKSVYSHLINTCRTLRLHVQARHESTLFISAATWMCMKTDWLWHQLTSSTFPCMSYWCDSNEAILKNLMVYPFPVFPLSSMICWDKAE